ncbi:MAG: EAL domain-containing protein [Magnetococcales bacterium]|nr:EAL domain-containing protein [Magnetococcales bacterium]
MPFKEQALLMTDPSALAPMLGREMTAMNTDRITKLEQQLDEERKARVAVEKRLASLAGGSCDEIRHDRDHLEISRHEALERADKQMRRVVEERLRAEARGQMLAQVVEQAASSIMITDRRGHIEYVNANFLRVSGYRLEEVVGKNPSFLRSGTTSKEVYQELWGTIMNGGEWRGELQNRRKNGEYYWTALTVTPIRDTGGSVTHFAGIGEDITDRKRAEAQIERLSHYDVLTAMPNRSFFQVHMFHLFAAAKRSKSPLMLLLLDIDQFKDINDTMGSGVGDQLLVSITQRLGLCTRECDLVARMGGDEFAALLVGQEDADDAVVVAERIIHAMARPFHLEDHGPVTLSVSIGIAVFPEDAVDPDQFMKNAGLALHRSKREGGAQYQFYTHEMEEEVLLRKVMETDLRQALDAGDQLFVYFQPQVEAGSGRLVGAEALVRWIHPERGFISPADFIPLAERNNLILPVGEWVLRTVCEHMRNWREAGLQVTPVAVNLSAGQFRHDDLLGMIRDIIEETGIDPTLLNLEITESLVMKDKQSHLNILHRLRGMGVKLSLDDFGTGYSSLGYLTRFPIDKLKIDRAFVQNICDDHARATIVRAVVRMGQALGMTINVEGVETRQQLEVLQAHGVDEIQGFYFSKPVPADQFEKMLKSGVLSGSAYCDAC